MPNRGSKPNTQRQMMGFFLSFSALLTLSALFVAPIDALLPNFWKLLSSTQSLIVDACAVAGLNGALLNAGLLGFICCFLYAISRARLAGVNIGAYFLTVGMSFFGKNCLNVWPIFLGAYLYCRVKKEPFGKHVHFALFGCALAPFVSEMLFPTGQHIPLALGIALAFAVGVFIGFVMPPLSTAVFQTHKGHNLYNAGLAAGLLGFAMFSIYRTLVLNPLGLEEAFTLNAVHSAGFPVFFPVLFGAAFTACIVAGFFLNGRSFHGYRRMLHHTGYGVDHTMSGRFSVVLINLGFLGLMFLAYALLIGAPFTGMTVGSLLCLVCWAGSGSTPRNTFPILIGYFIVSRVASWGLDAQPIMIGLCFATGLAPLAGRWGFGWGIVAGALHACFVTYTAAFHGGFNVYNGGFTSGLVAILLVPILETFFADVPQKRRAREKRRMERMNMQRALAAIEAQEAAEAALLRAEGEAPVPDPTPTVDADPPAPRTDAPEPDTDPVSAA